MSVPIGSFSQGMKFLVRIEYSLSMPVGLAASRFNSSRRSSLVFMIAFVSTSWAFTGVLVSVEVRADPKGRTSTAADNLFHERQQDRKGHRLEEGIANSSFGCGPVVAMEEKAVMSATTTLG